MTKEEILKIKAELNAIEKAHRSSYDSWGLVGKALQEVAEFLDTMEQEPSLPSDVDEAAEEYAGNHYTNSFDQRICIKEFKAGVKWRDAQIPKLPDGLEDAALKAISGYPPVVVNGEYFYIRKQLFDIFEDGAKWMAGQFEEEAHEEEVQELYQDEDGVHCVVSVGVDYNPGDKVIVQIRKV